MPHFRKLRVICLQALSRVQEAQRGRITSLILAADG
jgi:hypothetical protein